MDKTYKNITADKAIGCEKAQLIQEGEIVVPDSKPDIDIILKTDAYVYPEMKRTEENRLSYKGNMVVDVLYMGKDKGLHSMTGEAPISDFINIDGAAEDMLSNVDMRIVNMESKKVNDRKVSYKAMLETEGSVTEQADIDAVEGIEGLPEEQQRKTAITTNRVVVSKTEDFSVQEHITLPATKPPIAEILSVEAEIANSEVRAGEDSVSISGDLSITMLYISTEGSFPEVYEFDVPFNGTLEAEGAEADMYADAMLYIKNVYYDVSENDEGESGNIDIDVSIGAELTVSEAETNRVLEDAYILNNTVDMTSTELCYTAVVCRNRSQCPVKEVVTIPEGCPDMLQIFKTGGRAYIDNVQIYENRVVLEGVINTDIMYITGNDEMPVYCCNESIPFSQSVEARGAKEGMDASVQSSIAHIGFNMLSDREVEVRCALNTSTTVKDMRCVTLVTDVDIQPMGEELLDRIPGIAIYTVRKGDTLWKLAKRFNTTVADILKLNDSIENPDLIYPGQRLIIVKKRG